MQRGITCPLKFKVAPLEGAAAGVRGQNLYIRAVAVFKRPEHLSEAVKRCPLHIQEVGGKKLKHKKYHVKQGETTAKGHSVHAWMRQAYSYDQDLK